MAVLSYEFPCEFFNSISNSPSDHKEDITVTMLDQKGCVKPELFSTFLALPP